MRRDHGPLLALRRPRLGVHLRFLLSVVRTVMAEATAPATAIPHAAEGHAKGQQHPIRLYLAFWAWLFVLSACSYMVDYFGVQGLLRWALTVAFMMLKAGLIVPVLIHMALPHVA